MKQQERTLKKPNKNPSDPPPTTLPPVTSPPQPSPTTQPPTCGCILPETQPPTPNPDCVACSETGSTNGQSISLVRQVDDQVHVAAAKSLGKGKE